MQTILNNALPFFALIFCGYAAGRLNLLTATAAAGVNTFVFYFALPAFLFALMSSSPIAEVLNLPFIGAYVVASLAVVGLTLDGVLLIPLGILLIESDKGRGEGPLRTALATIPNLVRNPLIVSIFAGLAASAVGLSPPTPVDNFLDLLG